MINVANYYKPKIPIYWWTYNEYQKKVKIVKQAYIDGYYKASEYAQWLAGTKSTETMIALKNMRETYMSDVKTWVNRWWFKKWEVYMWTSTHQYDVVDMYSMAIERGSLCRTEDVPDTALYIDEAYDLGEISWTAYEYWLEHYAEPYVNGEITKSTYRSRTESGYLHVIYNNSEPTP